MAGRIQYGVASSHQGGGPVSQGIMAKPANGDQSSGLGVRQSTSAGVNATTSSASGGAGLTPLAKPVSTMAPALNKYIQDKFPKDYKGTGVYTELARQLEEFLAQGEKGTKLTYKYIVKTAAARLAQYEYLPPAVLRTLVGFFYSEDKKLVRTAFYLVQRLLGPGAGGTPIPAPPGLDIFLASAELRKPELAIAWRDVGRAEANPLMREFQLKVLAAAARVHPDAMSPLADAVKGMLMDCGIDPKAKKGAGDAKPRVDPAARAILLESAFGATRAALPSKPSTFTLVAKRAFHGVDSPNVLAARHCLSLMAQLSATDAGVVEKDLRVNAQLALKRYETMKSFDTSSAIKAGQAVGINLDDAYSRVYLARICGNVMQVEKKDSEGAFFRLLMSLAVRDPSDMVALEAIKAMGGYTVAPRPTLDMDIMHPHYEAQALKRAKAWQVLVKQLAPPKSKAGDPPPATPKLIAGIGARIKRALQTKKGPLVCGACKAVAALAEARARGTAGQSGDFGMSTKAAASAPLDNMMDVLRAEMLAVLESNYGPSERSLALTALLWMQSANAPPVVTPERIYANITVGGTRPASSMAAAAAGSLDPWPRECLQPVMHLLVQSARAVPALVQYRIECAMALAHGAPGRVSGDCLVDLWRLAAQGKQEARSTAVASALALLGSTPPPVTSATSGASSSVVVQAAAEGAAWVRLQKLAAWWLGENINHISGEWVGQAIRAAPKAEANGTTEGEEGDKKKKKKKKESEAGEEITRDVAVSNAEALMLEAGRSPVMVTVLDALQRALLSGAWPVRVAAAEAMGKVAVRSPEPYRLQCYSVLTSLTRAHGAGGLSRDVLGVLSVARPILGSLDTLYVGQLAVEHMATQNGMEAVDWPDDALKELRDKHEAAVKAVEAVVGKLPVASGFPLGATSRALLTTDVEEERKLKEEEDSKKNPDKWKAADASDTESELSDREPAPWDRPGYDAGGSSTARWDEEREPAPWDRASDKPPWDRDAAGNEGEEEVPPWQRRQAAPWENRVDEESDDESDDGRRGGNPWEAPAREATSSPLPWERREPAPWEKQLTPAESSDDEDTYGGRGRYGGGGYEEETTTVKDDFWDSYGASQTLPTPSSSFDANLSTYDTTTTSAYDAYGAGFTTPELSDDERANPSQPTGRGTIVHEFDAEGDEELTVVVGDEVDVFEETEGWLLCRTSDGRMGLVPATYVQLGGTSSKKPSSSSSTKALGSGTAGQSPAQKAKGTKGHKREPTLGDDNPWETGTVEEAARPEATEISFSEGLAASKPTHKREPTFEFEEGGSAPEAVGGGRAANSSFKFEAAPTVDATQRKATALYGFDAEDPEELTVAPGDDLIVHKEADGWCTATRVADGTRGLVPSSYVQML